MKNRIAFGRGCVLAVALLAGAAGPGSPQTPQTPPPHRPTGELVVSPATTQTVGRLPAPAAMGALGAEWERPLSTLIEGATYGWLAGGLLGVGVALGVEELGGPIVRIESLLLGASTLMPLGVHVANGRRGRYPPAALASVAILVAGLGIAEATDAPAVAITLPVLQFAAAVHIERRTARRRPGPPSPR
ncbi:MAG: hypothetical protein M3P51_15920 [Chloroflexota bacterium]|nr:hypothetical protein [Chloroflexota bacterium]